MRMMMKILTLIHRVENMLFVPRCVACGIRLGAEDADESGEIPPLCPSCMLQYKMAKEQSCPICVAKLSECLCTTHYMKREGLSRMMKLFRYEAREPKLPANRLIYAMKRKNLRIVTDFVAKELAAVVRYHLKNVGEWHLTYAPRTKAMRRLYGFDQSERLAIALARELDIPVLHCLIRNSKASVQKTLNHQQRIANMKNAYRVKNGVSLAGMKILVLDDIVTTGATMLSATVALRRAGAKSIIGIAPGAACRHVTPGQRRRLKKKYAVQIRLSSYYSR